MDKQVMTREIESMCSVVESELARRKITANVVAGRVMVDLVVDVSRMPNGKSHLARTLAHQFKAQRCAVRVLSARQLKIEIG